MIIASEAPVKRYPVSDSIIWTVVHINRSGLVSVCGVGLGVLGPWAQRGQVQGPRCLGRGRSWRPDLDECSTHGAQLAADPELPVGEAAPLGLENVLHPAPGSG